MKLFIIVLRYLVPMQEIDLSRDSHLEFLDQMYEKGIFLLSGRQEPANGGIIMAKANSRLEIQNIIIQDPFYIKNLAEYSFYEFKPNKSIKELEFLIHV